MDKGISADGTLALLPPAPRQTAGDRSTDPFADERVATVYARSDDLALLLMRSSLAAAHKLVLDACAELNSIGLLYACLFEPAARRLGNLWHDDACQETDLTLAIGRLQQLSHEVDPVVEPPCRCSRREVLVAAQPGENHLLGASLHAELLWRAGVCPQFASPVDDDELEAILAGTWFDALDLCMSPALLRPHRLAQLARTIARARLAAANPQLVVVVGGRQFFADPEAGAVVGADAACRVATDVLWLTYPTSECRLAPAR